jgi:hypothetical protein
MKKKIIALTLAVGMLGSMASLAFADEPVAPEQQPSASAGIEFEFDVDGPPIVDPPDPEDPGLSPEEKEFWERWTRHNRMLEFGTHEIHSTNETYDSWEDAQSMAGLAIKTPLSWQLDVKIGAFLDESKGNLENLKTSELRFGLNDQGTFQGNPPVFKGENDGLTKPIKKAVSGTGLGASAPVMTGTLGTHAFELIGYLETGTNSATEVGDFSAELYWEFVPLS